MSHPPNHALYTTAQVRALDAHAIDVLGIGGDELMRRAARAAFDVLCRRWPQASRIIVACGPGNNGGDGFLLAALALEASLDARVLALTTDSRGDAAHARQTFVQAGGRIDLTWQAADMEQADVIVDALYGSGLTRPLRDDAATLVETINASGKPVLALDVPSGLNANTGTADGAVIRASATTCFVAWKRGLFTGQAADCCGTLSLHTLGLPDTVQATQEADAILLSQTALPARSRDSHKGRYGHVLVIGGDHGMGGAARLAGEAALRSGAGLVSVATRGEHVPALLSARPELMGKAVTSAESLSPLFERASVLALGPGLGQGEWGRDLWQAALASPLPLMLDADGLNLLAATPCDFDGRDVVLTPHPGEAARLLQCDTADVQADRFAAARALAARYRAVAVLKGAGSLVAAPDGRVAVCRHGNPGMASGGMGDVLGGIIAGLLAQHFSPWQATCLGVDLHARAGDLVARQGERGMLASDLFAPLRSLINGLDN
ncbi:MAG TPA: NAD(P)H-hydrate dehydratase [Oleiagrimonas sp.]|nr:NAD(P)H-hydrate dehydratase [Oleiagrimonas sp.]